MEVERIAEALAAQTEGRVVGMLGGQQGELAEHERAELESLAQLADRLESTMQPVHPSPALVRSLRNELVEEARSRMSRRKRRHRITVISAAVAGTVVSIASVAGGIVMLVKWLRARTEARQVTAA
ncbi:MAG: hypothetical protein PVF54_09995 [Anaerolineae bacterium]|jgi:hypothetical protein